MNLSIRWHHPNENKWIEKLKKGETQKYHFVSLPRAVRSRERTPFCNGKTTVFSLATPRHTTIMIRFIIVIYTLFFPRVNGNQTSSIVSRCSRFVAIKSDRRTLKSRYSFDMLPHITRTLTNATKHTKALKQRQNEYTDNSHEIIILHHL